MCGVSVPLRHQYCVPCKRQRSRESSDRFRAGISHAPGEATTRGAAVVGLAEVAKKFNLTRQRVQQIERVALLKVRRALLPFLAEHDPVAHQRLTARETPEQAWMSRTTVRRQLSREQVYVISGLKKLAEEYDQSGQAEIAKEIRVEVADLESRLAQIFRRRSQS